MKVVKIFEIKNKSMSEKHSGKSTKVGKVESFDQKIPVEFVL